jgi:hypothetical protein
LRTAAATLGFNNVIDAFHIVVSGEVPTRFFVDERRLATGGIRLTEALLTLATDQGAATDLSGEAESRWRLVEEAWDARAANRQVTVLYDAPRELLVPALLGKRRPITEVRPALNGYQKGHCFFCFRPIAVVPSPHGDGADVDHFFPYVLNARGSPSTWTRCGTSNSPAPPATGDLREKATSCPPSGTCNGCTDATNTSSAPITRCVRRSSPRPGGTAPRAAPSSAMSCATASH